MCGMKSEGRQTNIEHKSISVTGSSECKWRGSSSSSSEDASAVCASRGTLVIDKPHLDGASSWLSEAMWQYHVEKRTEIIKQLTILPDIPCRFRLSLDSLTSQKSLNYEERKKRQDGNNRANSNKKTVLNSDTSSSTCSIPRVRVISGDVSNAHDYRSRPSKDYKVKKLSNSGVEAIDVTKHATRTTSNFIQKQAKVASIEKFPIVQPCVTVPRIAAPIRRYAGSDECMNNSRHGADSMSKSPLSSSANDAVPGREMTPRLVVKESIQRNTQNKITVSKTKHEADIPTLQHSTPSPIFYGAISAMGSSSAHPWKEGGSTEINSIKPGFVSDILKQRKESSLPKLDYTMDVHNFNIKLQITKGIAHKDFMPGGFGHVNDSHSYDTFARKKPVKKKKVPTATLR